MSLVEIMVSLLIGLVVIAGALTAQQQYSAALRTATNVARLQEVARLALDVLEADIRMANYWGLNNQPASIDNRAEPGVALPPPFNAAQGTRIDQCGGAGSRWAIHLEEYIGGSDDGYALACAAVGTASGGADTLVVRRGSDAAPESLDPNRIHLQTTRTVGTLFVPASSCTNPANAACLPAGYAPAASQTRRLVVHAYYVVTSSPLKPGLPALRRKALGNVNAAAVADAINDEEIAPGVEDLQVRFGIDSDGNGSVDQFVDPGAVPAGAAPVSATLWLRIRSEEREIGHVDSTAYQYADMAAAWTPNDAHRRIVVSKTLDLRNARS